jgi:hypothetical protein
MRSSTRGILAVLALVVAGGFLVVGRGEFHRLLRQTRNRPLGDTNVPRFAFSSRRDRTDTGCSRREENTEDELGWTISIWMM